MYRALLQEFVQMSRQILGENLTGIYLHGSLAMGCFNPAKSDLDLLLVVEKSLPEETKIRFMEQVVRLNGSAPAKGIEMSVVLRKDCKPFVYPTPYDLHFSVAHLARFTQDPHGYVERFQGTDKDLAAHAAIIHRFGIPLFGPPVSHTFGTVSKSVYADSIWYDVSGAEEEILENPVYMTLNLCRALGYLAEDLVLSKQTGGAWALESPNVPIVYHDWIREALRCYESDAEMASNPEMGTAFASYMVEEIKKRKLEAELAELQCQIHPFGSLPNLKFVVVCSLYQGKYLLSRHQERTTWETQGGHIEPGETPLDTAKRELYEESGVTDAELIPVCDYLGYRGKGYANGAVFLAKVNSLGNLPESEMAEIRLFEDLPENLTYPLVTPALMEEAKKFLGNENKIPSEC